MTFLYIVCLCGQLNFSIEVEGTEVSFFSMTPETLAWGVLVVLSCPYLCGLYKGCTSSEKIKEYNQTV